MSFEDWMFAIHLLFAATLVGGLVMSWIIVVSLYTADTADTTLNLNRVGLVGVVAIALGLLGTIVIGIWVAILRANFHPWDGWVIGAIVLWAIATAALMRAFAEYRKPVDKAKELLASGQTGSSSELVALNRATTGLMLRAVASAAVVLIVIDMIYKPGA
jgi:MFS family permease